MTKTLARMQLWVDAGVLVGLPGLNLLPDGLTGLGLIES